jgi:hypothetical protein
MSLRVMIGFAMLALSQGFLLAPLATRTPARAVSPTMGYEDVALNCIEEGCSVDTVEDLIAELKATKNKTSAMKATMKQLEALLVTPEANKNEIEKLVFAASRSFSVVDSFEFKGEPLGYTGETGTTLLAGEAFKN